jgi:MoxR-like ATPase
MTHPTIDYAAKLNAVIAELDKVIVGHREIKKLLAIAIAIDAHVIAESRWGQGKTSLIKTVQQTIFGARSGDENRIDMLPDTQPGDIIGYEVFNPQTGAFENRFGPIKGAHIVLADELNRAPPRAQSALLRAMQERSIKLGGKTYPLEDVFLVFATINPTGSVGTYSLEEPLLDRFCFHAHLDYNTYEEEVDILSRIEVHGRNAEKLAQPVITLDEILAVRALLKEMAGNATTTLKEYIVRLVRATRPEEDSFHAIVDEGGRTFEDRVAVGAGARCLIWLLHSAAAWAFMDGRSVIEPDDVQAVLLPVCRHRIMLTEEAKMDGFKADTFVTSVMQQTKI